MWAQTRRRLGAIDVSQTELLPLLLLWRQLLFTINYSLVNEYTFLKMTFLYIRRYWQKAHYIYSICIVSFNRQYYSVACYLLVSQHFYSRKLIYLCAIQYVIIIELLWKCYSGGTMIQKYTIYGRCKYV